MKSSFHLRLTVPTQTIGNSILLLDPKRRFFTIWLELHGSALLVLSVACVLDKDHHDAMVKIKRGYDFGLSPNAFMQSDLDSASKIHAPWHRSTTNNKSEGHEQ